MRSPGIAWLLPLVLMTAAETAPAASPRAPAVVYEDDMVRIRLVSVPAGATRRQPAQPEPAVLVVDAGDYDRLLGADAGIVDRLASPQVIVQSPQPARRLRNAGSEALHFTRIEFKTGIVPGLLHPQWPEGRMPRSNDGSDPAGWDAKFDSPVAAPDVQKIAYQDQRIRILTLAMPLGIAEPLHHHPYPTVWLIYGNRPASTEDTDALGNTRQQSLPGNGPAATLMLLPPGARHSSKALTAGNRIVRIEFLHGFR